MQRLPASPDAFVWLRLYQAEMQGKVPAGRDQPLWWTLRRPFRPLTYHAARAMFVRAGALLGANWSLHDLRHTAAYRMARDKNVPLTDVQWIFGHAQLTTTQIYTTPTSEDVIASVLAHHARRADGPAPAAEAPADAATLRIGRNRWRSFSGGPDRDHGVRAAGPCPAVARSRQRRLLAGGQGDLASLLDRFPPRPAAKTWAVTRQPREQLLDRLLSPPFRMDNTQSQANRKAGATQLLAWLESLPGETWQERWAASGAEEAADWRALPARWIKGGHRTRDDRGPEVSRLGTGMILLVTGDALRPGLPFLLTFTSRHLAAEMARTRDPEGSPGWKASARRSRTVPSPPGRSAGSPRSWPPRAAWSPTSPPATAWKRCSLMNGMFHRGSDKNAYFYQLMHATDAFPDDAPASMRTSRDPRAAHSRADDRPVRHRLPAGPRPAGGLPEGTPAVRRLRHLAEPRATARIVFWRDLELHHPGINSLHLPPDVAAGGSSGRSRPLSQARRRRGPPAWRCSRSCGPST